MRRGWRRRRRGQESAEDEDGEEAAAVGSGAEDEGEISYVPQRLQRLGKLDTGRE